MEIKNKKDIDEALKLYGKSELLSVSLIKGAVRGMKGFAHELATGDEHCYKDNGTVSSRFNNVSREKFITMLKCTAERIANGEYGKVRCEITDRLTNKVEL